MNALKHVLEGPLDTSPKGFQRFSKTSERPQQMYRDTRIYEWVMTLLCLGVEQEGIRYGPVDLQAQAMTSFNIRIA